MADIFISYSREDRARVSPLARALQRNGYTVWWDPELVPSQKFERTIKHELDKARCVIVVWTERSVGDDNMYRSEWVETEAGAGAERGVLVPVQFDQGRSHWRHRNVEYVELHDWSGDDAAQGFVALLKGVVHHAGPREPPNPEELEDWVLAESTNKADALEKFAGDHPGSRFSGIALNRAARATLDRLISDGHLEDQDWLACAEHVLSAVDNVLEAEISEMEQLCPPELSPEEAQEAKRAIFELSMVVDWIPSPTAFSDRIDVLREEIDARTVTEDDD